MNTPTPKATSRCEICGERIGSGRYHGGKVKNGGTRFVHLECWEREQAERKAKEARR